MSLCLVCSAAIPESERAHWLKADRFCYGCHQYVCTTCIVKKGPIPPGPHDPAMHGAKTGPWPPVEPPPARPLPEPDPDPSASWEPSWQSYPVLTFDPATAIIEAFLIARDAGAKTTVEDRDRLRFQAARFLAKYRGRTSDDLKLARTEITRQLTRRRGA